ncbi:MAG: 16S rRNA (guanine(966)-N(2))-methyltransferase RsmD [Hyphomicrobiales bacterium]
MRIVGGKHRGAGLAGPRSNAIRPTSDRLRESLFNVLAHAYGDPVAGGRVLDLFSGTGALGLEAMSRGAAFCLFVEEAAEARGLIRQNVEALGLTGTTRLFRRDATSLGKAGTMAPFTLCFADPPYGRGLGEKALAAAADGGWLVPGALVVLEETADAEIELPEVFRLEEERRAGDSRLLILTFSPDAG